MTSSDDDDPMTMTNAERHAVGRRRLRRVGALGWLLALGAAVLVFSWQRDRQAPSEPPLPVLAAVPEFQLVDQHGQSVSRQDLLGQPLVVDFIFTRCPGICPTLTRRMVELSKDVPADVRLVSISVDPEHDTPAVLEAYAEKHGAVANWRFLTGPVSAIYPLIRDGFLLPVDPSPPSTGDGSDVIEPIVHSNRFVLVDAVGQIRGYYNAFDAADLEQLRHDVKRLL